MDNRVEHSICRAVRCIILFAITFAITLGILIGLLCISACIPQRAIKDNIYESAVYIQDNESLFHPLIKGAEFTITLPLEI